MNSSNDDMSFSITKSRLSDNTLNESHMLISYPKKGFVSNSSDEFRKIIDSISIAFSHFPICFDQSSIYYIHKIENNICIMSPSITNSYGKLKSPNIHRRVQKI